MAEEKKQKPKAKVIKPEEKKKSTAKKVSKKETVKKTEVKKETNEIKEFARKSSEVIKEEAKVAADKISKVSEEISDKVAHAASDINEETPIVTKETMSRVIYALIIVVVLVIVIKIFGMFIDIGESLFKDNRWVLNRAESYLANFANDPMDEIDCDKKSKYKDGFIVKCEFESVELENKWMTDEIYVGVKENKHGYVSYCAPSTYKADIRRCLRKN